VLKEKRLQKGPCIRARLQSCRKDRFGFVLWAFVSGHDFSRAEKIAQQLGLQPLRAVVQTPVRACICRARLVSTAAGD
jgi:hypothetical protein